MVPNIVLAFSKLKQLTFLLLLWYISQSFQYGLPEIVRASTELAVTVNFSETLFLHPLLLSRISSIIIFEVRTRTVLLKNKTLILSDQSSNSTFNVHNPHRMKLFTRLQVGLNHCVNTNLDKTFKTSDNYFVTTLAYRNNIHFFLHCSNYSNQRKILFDKISNIVLCWTKMMQL